MANGMEMIFIKFKVLTRRYGQICEPILIILGGWFLGNFLCSVLLLIGLFF